MHISTVVVAGGSGRRFGSLKQFATLGSGSVIEVSVRTAAQVSDQVVLVLPPTGDFTSSVGSLVLDLGDKLVTTKGGASRTESVKNGLQEVTANEGLVFVHDAARPLATPSLYQRLLKAREPDADGVVPGIPVGDTLKRAENNFVAETVDREDLWAIQTPQLFDLEKLRQAHARPGQATDDAGLLETQGGRIQVVEGETTNLKITHPTDLDYAQWLWTSRGEK